MKGKIAGSACSVDVAADAHWREAHWKFTEKPQFPAGSFATQQLGLDVDLAERPPEATAQRHLHVDIGTFQQPTGHRTQHRSRTAMRTQHARVDFAERGVQTDVRALDLKALYVRLQVATGMWILVVALEQLEVDSWYGVTIGQLEHAIMINYRDHVRSGNNLAFTVGNRKFVFHGCVGPTDPSHSDVRPECYLEALDLSFYVTSLVPTGG